jgi:probable HAF family extracellular repeat protein
MKFLIILMFTASCVFADGFVYAKGKLMRFSYPGSIETKAFDINDRDEIVGWHSDCFGRIHGFVMDGNKFRSIDHPNASGWGTVVTGLNNRGTLVGSYGDGDTVRGFLCQDGKFIPIEYPGVDYTEPFGINNNGTVVGFYWDGLTTHGFVYEKGRYRSLDVPGALSTQLYGVNEKGQIVGAYLDGHGNSAAFIYDKGVFVHVSSWYGINNKGGIAEMYLEDHGDPRGALVHGINNKGHIVGEIE